MQAVLQAAYIRQLLDVPPAGSNYPAPAAAAQQQQSSAVPASSAAAGAAAGEVDVRAIVADSSKKARSSLQPFISQASWVVPAAGLLCSCAGCRLAVLQKHRCLPPFVATMPYPPLVPQILLPQLEEQGWQMSPFMLSSTEKQRFLRL